MMQQWFKDAKLGIFLHWGIYTVNGIGPSWPMSRGQISYEDYMMQCKGFTAKNYDPQKWAKLFKKAGAKYAVLTTKHHDGVALWDTKLSDLSVVKKTPAARDLVGPYCDALREEGLKVGLYFSHTDWSNDDHFTVAMNTDLETLKQWRKTKKDYFPDWNLKVNLPEDKDKLIENKKTWERFLKFHRGQLTEILTNYGDIDLIWFDVLLGQDTYDYRCKEIADHVHKINSNIVINSRLREYGDYETPERGAPINPIEKPWEFCNTMNRSWSYVPKDQEYKSPGFIIRMFAECIGMGGNLLLAVGPKEDGTIPEEHEKRLLILGDWISVNQEAIYGTEKGLPHAHFCGASTMSKDKTVIYMFYFDIPKEGIAVKGIRNDIRKITILSTGEELKSKRVDGMSNSKIPGVLWIDLPQEKVQPYTTVIKLELEGELDLYRGKGMEINVNDGH